MKEALIKTAMVVVALLAAGASAPSRAQQMDGKALFLKNCAACHQLDGKGIPGSFPPLAGSDFLNADITRAIRVVTGGLTGAVTVNGNTFNGVMPAWQLSDAQVSSVLTFVSNSWGNAGKDVTPTEVGTNRVHPAPMAGGSR